MTPEAFINSATWRHTRDEIRWEILAVCLPILVYLVSLLLAEYGIKPNVNDWKSLTPLGHFLAIPDAIFGGCILFAFSAIHGFRRGDYPEYSQITAFDAISRWRLLGIAGLIVSTLVAAASIMFHVPWALFAGLVLLYAGGLTYKKVIFHRTYLSTLAKSSVHD